MSESPSELETLTRLARELVDRVNDLNAATGSTIIGLVRETRNNRRLIWLVAIGFVLDVILTIAMAFVVSGVSSNNSRIDQVNSRLNEEQTVQRAKGLCPMYKLFIDSEKFTPPNQTPDQAKARSEAFKIIHQSYDALNCKKITG